MLEVPQKLLLDTSFIVALFYGDKSSISKAQSILPALITVDRLYMNNYVLSEVLTVLSQRVGKKKTKECIQVLYDSHVGLLNVTRVVESRAFNEFLKIDKKNISYADVISVLQAKEKGINAILTLDKHFLYLGEKYDLKIFCP